MSQKPVFVRSYVRTDGIHVREHRRNYPSPYCTRGHFGFEVPSAEEQSPSVHGLLWRVIVFIVKFAWWVLTIPIFGLLFLFIPFYHAENPLMLPWWARIWLCSGVGYRSYSFGMEAVLDLPAPWWVRTILLVWFLLFHTVFAIIHTVVRTVVLTTFRILILIAGMLSEVLTWPIRLILSRFTRRQQRKLASRF